MRLLVCMMFTVLVGMALGGDAADPVKVKLGKAKQTYQAAREKNRDFLLDLLAKQEESARKGGKDQLVTKIKAAREAYEKGGPLPGGLSAAAKQRFMSARSAMDKAFAAAAKDYLKQKKDDLAAEVNKEWEAFKLDISDDPNVVRLLNKNSEKYATVAKGGTEPRVLQNEPGPELAQRFRMAPADKGGWITLQSLDGKYFLSSERGGTGDGTQITMAEPRAGVGAPTQQWALAPTPDGWMRIVHRASGKVIGVLDRSKANGGRLVIWTNVKNEPNQEWKFD